MKKTILITILSLSLGSVCKGQGPVKDCQYGEDEILKIVDGTNGMIIVTPPAGGGKIPDPPMVSAKTFNQFVAKKQSYYLSGTSDLSLYKNFAISNITDGSLSIGHNFSKPKSNGRISTIYTIAAQSNIANNFANIFSKEEFNNDAGLNFKFTKLIATGTTIDYDTTDRKILDNKRLYFLRQLKVAIQENKRLAKLIPANVNTLESTMSLEDSVKARYCKDQSAKNLEAFYTFELEELDKLIPKKGYNCFFTHWFSAQIFMPVTRRKYDTAVDTVSAFSEQKLYNWSFNINYGLVYETKVGIVFGNARYKLFNNNTIEAKAPTVTKFNQYDFTTTPLANNLLSDDTKKVYVGPYETFVTSSVQGQLVYLLPLKSKDFKIGLSALVEKNFGEFDAVNATIGLPIFLKGKEKDKGVNVELQGRWVDFTDSYNPTLSRREKFSAGLSVSLPFGSVLY